MPEKPDFTVSDRRKFTPEGELRPDVKEETQPTEAPPKAAEGQPTAPPADAQEAETAGAPVPPAASPADQKAQHTAYKQSGEWIDDRLRANLGGRKPQDLQITFEKFVASLYMSALMQLGLMHHEGEQPPPPDVLSARQTIDTLGILEEKTRGNLSDAEHNLLQNCLYELRMAFVEITNALSRPPAPPPGGGK